jgi:hypothetical protein
MKMKSIFSYAMLVLVLSSCSKDEESSSPKMQFTFGEESYNLKDASLYYTTEGEDGGHQFKVYQISDGIYTNANGSFGYSLDDYTNATYAIAIVVSPTPGNEFEPGEFPQHNIFDGVDSNVGFITFRSDTNTQCSTDDTNNDFSPIVIKGGFEGDDTMTIDFDGTLSLRQNGDPVEVNGKIHFNGKIKDVRAL